MEKHKCPKSKTIIAAIGFGILVFLLMYYTYHSEPDLVLDAFVSILLMGFIYWKYDSLRQDNWSAAVVFFAVILHNLHLYGSAPLSIRFDHYMHFIGGFAIAIFIDRYFYEKLTTVQRFVLLSLCALGLGAIGEIAEWLGYGILGSGKGFFYYGIGDEGEWRNAVLDLIFDLAGGVAMAILTLFRRSSRAR
jgi:hypothetical protein